MGDGIPTQSAGFQSGQILGPEHHRFRLLNPLAPHPLGQLWQAEDISTTQPTAVTLLILAAELQSLSGFTDQLREQLNRNRALKIPHGARCYGVFIWRGLFFVSWEALDGLTLADMFAKGQTRKLKAEQKQGLITRLGQALETHLQQTGQPHATLCPELIYLNRRSGLRLMGFGWRPLLEPVLQQLPLPPGYPLWQSREAFHSQDLDGREDVHALACLIYQVYSGKPPFDAEEESRHSADLRPPGGLSREQWQLLQRALAEDANQRPATPMELVRQLYAPETPPASPAKGSDSASMATPEGEVREGLAATAPALRLPRISPGLPPWSRRAAAAGLLFAAGVALGYWLGSGATPDSSVVHNLRLENQRLQQALQQRPATGQSLDAANAISAASPEPSPSAELAEEEADQKPADNLTLFRDQWAQDRFAPQMVVLPKGRFRMGDLHGQGDENEYPVHEVVIEHTFALGRHEVTFEEYDQFALDTDRPLPDDEGWGRGHQPVINVSWEDARDYAAWLAEQTGEPYRLPTEAEWEYAARAGTETLYWWGDHLSPGMAVCDGCGTAWDGQHPAPVGSLPANPWGLHDLNGNVDEWVQDCYAPGYQDAPQDGRAHTDPNCRQRVMRGGSWFEIPRLVRSASRYRHPQDSRRNSWGFRVAMDLMTPPERTP